jgi:glycine/D-amino acid oxidase-like deaminating enzyme
MSEFDYAVIGKGLIGSAAARYLSESGQRVLVVGPDEPKTPLAHQGVFASHYDQGRITRLIGRDAVYSKLAERAIDQYGALEASTNVRFHFPVGTLIAQTPDVSDGHMRDPLGTARRLRRRFTFFERGDRSWKDSFPFLDFPAPYSVIHEPAPAGYINPRDMIRAQLACAIRQGATIVRETAIRLTPSQHGHTIETDHAGVYTTQKVVIAAGAFSNCHDLIHKKLALQPETESILLGPVYEHDGVRLANAPTLNYLVDDEDIWDIYMTPPIRYPDGHFYIKLGANTKYDAKLHTLEAMGHWFRNGESDRARNAMTRAMRSLWPGLDFLSTETRRCILCRTPNGYPVIDEVDAGIFVAAGGNGGCAKNADALGSLAANLCRGEPWPSDIPRALFEAEYA